MASKVFLDANVLLDFTTNREGFVIADQIILAGINRNILLYTSPAVLHIASYYTSRIYTGPQTKKIMLTLMNDVQVIDCDHATALIALSNNIEDTEDALQYFTALKFNINFFISSDKKLKKAALPKLPVCTSSELLALLKKEIH
jgi:predicted nucleic acid-binding protein